jgi:hypothetical protein
MNTLWVIKIFCPMRKAHLVAKVFFDKDKNNVQPWIDKNHPNNKNVCVEKLVLHKKQRNIYISMKSRRDENKRLRATSLPG